jgi:K+-sensing histidine kinase KdpD
MAPKVADKKTDAEKKKDKQVNKAKANPKKAEDKAKTNLKRRVARGQVVDPSIESAPKTAPVDTGETDTKIVVANPVKKTSAEKEERRRLKLIEIERAFALKRSEEERHRIQSLINST